MIVSTNNDESCWGDTMCHLVICELLGIEKWNLKGFKYLFSVIVDGKIQTNKYLADICQVVEKFISTDDVEYLFVKPQYEFYLIMDEV